MITDNVGIELFVNGSLVGSVDNNLISDWSGNNEAGLGASNNGINVGVTGDGLFEGDIAIFRLYEEALDASDVADNFQAIAGISVTQVNGVDLPGVDTPIALAGGDLYMAADGSYRFERDPGFVGEQTFTYTLEDVDGNTDVATVTINSSQFGITTLDSDTDR